MNTQNLIFKSSLSSVFNLEDVTTAFFPYYWKGKVSIVELCYSDTLTCDYNDDLFIKDKDDNFIASRDVNDIIQLINTAYKPKDIDPQCLIKNSFTKYAVDEKPKEKFSTIRFFRDYHGDAVGVVPHSYKDDE